MYMYSVMLVDLIPHPLVQMVRKNYSTVIQSIYIYVSSCKYCLLCNMDYLLVAFDPRFFSNVLKSYMGSDYSVGNIAVPRCVIVLSAGKQMQLHTWEVYRDKRPVYMSKQSHCRYCTCIGDVTGNNTVMNCQIQCHIQLVDSTVNSLNSRPGKYGFTIVFMNSTLATFCQTYSCLQGTPICK